MGKTKLLYWIIQFISWGSFCGMIGTASILQDDFTERTFFKLIQLFFLLILISHTIRWVFINKDWLNLKVGLLIPRALGLIFSLSALLLIINNATGYLLYDEKWVTGVEFFVNVLMYTIFLIMWTAVYLTYHLMQKSRLQEINNLKLKTSQTQNELKTLRDQLNPHFLFNSLNSIRALIELDPETAKSAITTLSNLLRSSLILGKKSYITLEEELQLVNEYLKLEKIRFEERLNYSINNQIQKKLYIPPFLIQSMAENAIKHGISKSSKKGEMTINVYYLADELIMEVDNTGEYKKTKNSGIGISNTKRRLEILYGEHAGFDIKNQNNMVKTLIWIKKNQLKHTK
jgi:sensor histidine kinase YesM